MSPDGKTEYDAWHASPFVTKAERAELDALSADARAQLFAQRIGFGTAGLRGILAPGPGGMNVHTVRVCAEALARFFGRGGGKRAVVGFDARRRSAELAHEAALVLASHGVSVLLMREPRPTPMLSFAVERSGADFGLCVTASHNPPQYNGCKVYRRGGAQMEDEQARAVEREMAHLALPAPPPALSEEQARAEGFLSDLGSEPDEAYAAFVLSSMTNPAAVRASHGLRVVYTPCHGVGGLIAPRLLREAGITQLFTVAEQMEPDGEFPTLPVPNPEEERALTLAFRLAERERADLILANDPDADRLAVAARDRHGAMRVITGNQLGALLADHLLSAYARAGKPQRPCAVVKTIVTTELAARVARKHGAQCYDTFTGFKHLARKAQQLEAAGVLPVLGFEESIGYMPYPQTRDKDGVQTALLVAEMACALRARGQTLHDALDALYAACGCFDERTVSLSVEGAAPMERMAQMMASLRALPPKRIMDERVTEVTDYLRGERTFIRVIERESLPLAGENVLAYTLENGCRVVVRPSGTEPKIKIYALARGSSRSEAERCAAAIVEDAPQALRLNEQ